MTQILSLGARNKVTDEYVHPKIANKKDEYICPDCNKDVIFCKGEKIDSYFRHKVDSVNPCHHYSNPGESQIHKDAKMKMKSLLERKILILFNRNCACACCKNEETFEISEITETSNILLEHKFDYNGPKIADVAYMNNGKLECIFEICNTHKTRSENRPEPWFEIDAETFINSVNNIDLTSIQIQIPCIRCEKCDECIEKEEIDEKNRVNRIKQEKIRTIKNEINNIANSRIKRVNNITSDDDADAMRLMRYNKQDNNYTLSLTNELIFIENNITYVLGNNIVVIEHPLTHTILRRSLVKNNTFYKGKWRTNISIKLIMQWYISNYDIIDDLF